MPLINQTFSQIITFTRSSGATYFDATGTLQTAATDVPRFDYDPSTLAAQGLLIEEARTNSIRNNTMQGAVAGTPGIVPTNWAIASPNAGLTREIVGVGTQNGITYVDVRFSGTTTGTSANIIFPENNTFVAALNGQSWAASSWIALVGGSFTNITASNLVLRFNDGAGSLLTSNSTSFLGATATQVRYATAGTASNASTAFVATCIQLGFSNGVAIDITLRIGLPQLEQGAFATSVIPTTVAAVTRSADVASVNTLSPWFNATEGTLYGEFSSYAANLSRAVVGISDGTNTNRVQFFTGAGASPYSLSFRIVSGGTQTNPSNAGTIAVDAVGKAALAYAVGTNQGAASVNGNTPGTSSPTVAPIGLNVMELGKGSGVSQLAGHLRRIVYYPRRLSNAELQSITS